MGVIENMREVADLVKQIGDIDLNRKIVNLEREVHELTREKMRLETKLAEAEKVLALKQKLTFKEPFYWLEGDRTPYCAPCWEASQRQVHVKFVDGTPEASLWKCPHCNHDFRVEKERCAHGSGQIVPRVPHGGPQGWMGV